jgi:hypothetical protein
MRFTVESLPSVDETLTRLWLDAPDRQAVRDAADWIERQLKHDPLEKVTAVDNLYYIRRDPLVALCEIYLKERLVKIVEIHRIDET